MRKWDLVRFKREAECPAWLGRDARGVVVEEGELSSKVLFFNPEIIGDYLIAQVSNVGLCRERVSIPPQYTRQFEPKLGELDWSKEKFNKLTFKEFDMVRLIRDREEYSECGVYKGDIGCVYFGWKKLSWQWCRMWRPWYIMACFVSMEELTGCCLDCLYS